MAEYQVRWSVREQVSGYGDGYSDGDTSVLAHGEVVKEGKSAAALAVELRTLLESTFPKRVVASTYEFDRIYSVNVTPVERPPQHLLVCRLSADARVEHLPAEEQDDGHGDYVRTRCGKLGRWYRKPGRDGVVCKRCSK